MNSAGEDDAGAVAPGGIPYDNKRQAELYWRQIEQLKGAAVCIRLSRNQLARRVKTVDVIKTIASSGAIAGWFASDRYKLFWAALSRRHNSLTC